MKMLTRQTVLLAVLKPVSCSQTGMSKYSNFELKPENYLAKTLTGIPSSWGSTGCRNGRDSGS